MGQMWRLWPRRSDGLGNQISRTQAILLIILATAIWGFSFPAVKFALGYYDTYAVMFMRSALSALILGLFLFWKKRGLSDEDWKAGLITGAVMAAAFVTQTYAQTMISATSSAFITGLYVIFAPLLAALFLSQIPSKRLMLCTLIAVAGLWFLGDTTIGLGLGEGLTLLCAIFFAVGLLLLSKYKRVDSAKLIFVQMLVCLAVGGMAMVATNHIPSVFDPAPMASILYLGIFAGAVAYWSQAKAQQVLPVGEASILLLGEPVFAGLFSVLFFSEMLSPMQLAGAGLILLAMYWAERKDTQVFEKDRHERKNGGS